MNLGEEERRCRPRGDGGWREDIRNDRINDLKRAIVELIESEKGKALAKTIVRNAIEELATKHLARVGLWGLLVFFSMVGAVVYSLAVKLGIIK